MSSRNRLLLLLVFFLFLSKALSAQNIKFEHLTSEHGLSNNTVRCIFQDSRGYIWVGTEDGLSRYNGRSFTSFKTVPDDTTSLSDNFINQVYEDRKGNIWIATNYGGLNLFDRETERFKRFKSNDKDQKTLLGNNISCICEDRESNLILLNTGLGLNYFQPKTNTFRRIPLDFDGYTNMDVQYLMAVDPQNVLWIVGARGLIRYDDKTKSIRKIAADKPLMTGQIIPESDDKFLVTVGNGLYRFDRKTEKYALVSKLIDDYSIKYGIQSIHADAQKMWLGTYNGGLLEYDKQKDKLKIYRHDKENTQSISSDIINVVFEDNAHSIWIGTYLGGINKFDRYRKFETELAGQIITSFGEYKGIEWVGTQTSGLHRYDPQTETWSNFQSDPKDPNSLSYNSVNAVLQDSKGRLWVGTWENGLNKVEKAAENSSKLKFEHLLKKESIQMLKEDAKHRIWVGSNGALFLYQAEDNTFISFYNEPKNPKSIGDGRIQAIEEDAKNNAFWVATWNGLYRAILPESKVITKDNVEFIPFRYNAKDSNSISDDKVLSLCLAKNGVLWVGTFAGGLNKIEFNPKGGGKAYKVTRYLQGHGLPSNCVFGIQEDPNGVLWISTNKGFVSLNPATGVFRPYDKNDGLQSDDFYWRSSYKSPTGKLFFGGSNGFNAFYPEKIKFNDHIPPVVITEFSIFNKAITISSPNSPLKKHISETTEITIKYNQSMISFEFAAMNYISSYKNKYQYMMVGFDNAWVDAGNHNKATYTNLDPGEYTFRVKASNNDGVWNEEGASIHLIILPPWWATWWFRTLFVLAVISAAVSFYLWRVNQLESQKAELEVKVAQRTSQLSQANATLNEQKEEILQQAEELKMQTEYLTDANTNLNKALESIRLISEFGQKITSTLKFDAINLMINEYINSLTDSDTYGIGIYHERSQTIVFPSFIENGQPIPAYIRKIDDPNSFSAYSLRNRKAIMINDLHHEYSKYIDALPSFRTKNTPLSLIHVPLLIDDKPIGVISVNSPDLNAYTENDFTNLQTLASYISIALDNSHLYEILEESNKNTHNSIRYAQTIQNAILPIPAVLDQYLENFVVFKPKDIVSGDFYCFFPIDKRTGMFYDSDISTNKADLSHISLYVAVVDCTGHGVPGAIMSMIAYSLLREIIRYQKIDSPEKILNQLNLEIFNTLRQDLTMNDDGLDIALCKIEYADEGGDGTQSVQLNYSGSKRKLLYSSDGSEIETLEGSGRYIGGKRSMMSKLQFVNHQLSLKSGDAIYLSSDGFADQPNNARKSLGSRMIIETINQVRGLPVIQQKEALLDLLTSHQGTEMQRDDITLMGIQL